VVAKDGDGGLPWNVGDHYRVITERNILRNIGKGSEKLTCFEAAVGMISTHISLVYSVFLFESTVYSKLVPPPLEVAQWPCYWLLTPGKARWGGAKPAEPRSASNLVLQFFVFISKKKRTRFCHF
jgi:hypothetical protein